MKWPKRLCRELQEVCLFLELAKIATTASAVDQLLLPLSLSQSIDSLVYISQTLVYSLSG